MYTSTWLTAPCLAANMDCHTRDPRERGPNHRRVLSAGEAGQEAAGVGRRGQGPPATVVRGRRVRGGPPSEHRLLGCLSGCLFGCLSLTFPCLNDIPLPFTAGLCFLDLPLPSLSLHRLPALYRLSCSWPTAPTQCCPSRCPRRGVEPCRGTRIANATCSISLPCNARINPRSDSATRSLLLRLHAPNANTVVLVSAGWHMPIPSSY